MGVEDPMEPGWWRATAANAPDLYAQNLRIDPRNPGAETNPFERLLLTRLGRRQRRVTFDLEMEAIQRGISAADLRKAIDEAEQQRHTAALQRVGKLAWLALQRDVERQRGSLYSKGIPVRDFPRLRMLLKENLLRHDVASAASATLDLHHQTLDADLGGGMIQTLNGPEVVPLPGETETETTTRFLRLVLERQKLHESLFRVRQTAHSHSPPHPDAHISTGPL